MSEVKSQNEKVKLEHRLTKIETILTERQETSKQFEKDVSRKLNTILRNSKSVVTVEALKKAINIHADSCLGRNPKKNESNHPAWMSAIMAGWRGLGLFGGLVGIIFLLLIVIMKLTEVI